MLIDFRDVYWSPEGRWAVNVGLSIVAAGGAYFSGLPLWRGLPAELAAQPSGKAAHAGAEHVVRHLQAMLRMFLPANVSSPVNWKPWNAPSPSAKKGSRGLR